MHFEKKKIVGFKLTLLFILLVLRVNETGMLFRKGVLNKLFL